MSADATTPRPWHVSLPDETLILGPDRQVVATTFRDAEDYDANYDTRYADAALIVRAVNEADALRATLATVTAERDRLLALTEAQAAAHAASILYVTGEEHNSLVECAAVLGELVKLKDAKDRGEPPPDYPEYKQLLWDDAREILARYRTAAAQRFTPASDGTAARPQEGA